jgi:GNAT superfamily N-acetyltransferase
MEVRPAADGDLPAIAKIALANGDKNAGSDPRYVAHLRANGRFLVAELDGEVAGYCGTRRIGGATMLCDLFVDPARHGGGIGGCLLDAIFEGNGERFTFASRDPRAMPLYIRHGMIPRWPLLYLSGPPGDSCALCHQKVSMEEAGTAELELTGTDRTADYAFWATIPGSAGLIVQDSGEIVAAGAAGPGQLIHLASAQDCDPAATLIAALSAFDTSRVRLCLPAPHPALLLLLDARWRIEDHDHHMSTIEGLLSPGHVPSPSLA